MMGAQFLDYEYSARVRNGQETSTEQMIKDICLFRQAFDKNKEKKEVSSVMKELELRYFVDIQKEQNIGEQDVARTRQIIEKIEASDEDDSHGRSRSESTDSEKMIREIYKENDPKTKSELETMNLYRAYKVLRAPLKKLSDAEKDLVARHLIADHLVEIHKKLMDRVPEFVGLMEGTPGEFTTEERWIEPEKGKKLPYHKFKTTNEVKKALEDLLYHYNGDIKDIHKMKDTKQRIEAVFKCAAKVLFGLGLIHAFLDGNGRTSRLACYYCLSLISPFPTPVYNVYSPSTRDEFGDSLMEARGGGNAGEETYEKLMQKILTAKPSKLCAILIEANWYMWKRLLSDLKIKV